MRSLDLINWTIETAASLNATQNRQSPETLSPISNVSVELAAGPPISNPTKYEPEEAGEPLRWTHTTPTAPTIAETRTTNENSDSLHAIIEPRVVTKSADRDRAIALRWTLRDIRAGRLQLSPVCPTDLNNLIAMGLVELKNGAPQLTQAGERAISVP